MVNSIFEIASDVALAYLVVLVTAITAVISEIAEFVFVNASSVVATGRENATKSVDYSCL